MRLLLLLSLAASAGAAAAVECGQTIDRDVVLTRDLVCPGPGPVLRIVRSGVTLALDGHAIRAGAGAPAVELVDVDGVTVRGPGRIAGALSAIEATRTTGLRVHGIDFVGVGEGVRLTNSREAEIGANRFAQVAGHAVVARTLPGAYTRGGGHRIVDNTVYGAEYGVLVDAPGTRIAGNRFDAIATFGVIATAPDVTLEGNRYATVGLAPVVH